MPVYGNICDVGQDFGGAVTAFLKVKQTRCLIDEFGVVFVVQERRMLQQVFHKRNVGADAANTEFAERTVHAGNRHFRGRGACGHFGQQTVIEARDYSTRIGGATIQPDTRTSG